MEVDCQGPARVIAVAEDGPAAAAGIRIGDVLWQVNGVACLDVGPDVVSEALAREASLMVVVTSLSSATSHTSQLA